MATDKIALSAASRANLLALNRTNDLIGRTQQRLASGLRVASALDDASAFFQARNLSNRASDLNAVKDGIDQGISSIQAAINGIDAITSVVEQIKGLAQAAKAQTTAERATTSTSIQNLIGELNEIAQDASYQGVNLIDSGTQTLTVVFNEDSSAVLTISHSNLTEGTASTGLQLSLLDGAISTETSIDGAISTLNAALTTLRSSAQDLGSNNTLLQTRLDFTDEIVNTLEEGSDKLTLADVNEEGANLLSLQTRQQLGINALSLAAQSEQSILALFG
jgi:flagellin-like hook-associated protein FlgL